MRLGRLLLLGTATAMFVAAPASATSFLFSLNANGTFGSKTFNATTGSETLSVRATAWSIQGTKVRESTLGAYGTNGLGVISGDDDGGTNNQHTVDNQDRTDFLILQFSKPVELTSGVFTAFNLYDSKGKAYSYKDNDATIDFATAGPLWSSDAALDALIKDKNVSALNTLLNGDRFESTGNGTSSFSSPRLLSTSGRYGTLWMVAASIANSDGRYDAFKFSTMTVNTRNVMTGVPEPGTWATMLTGFGIVGFALRRRKRRETALTA